MIGGTQAELFEEDFVEGIVVVLAGVDQLMIKVAVAGLDDGGQADDLRPGAEDGHDFEFGHWGEVLLGN